MTRRDLAWRCGGAVLFGLACANALVDRQSNGGVDGVVRFVLAIFAIVLMLQGKRVALLVRIERSRHRLLASAIRARRRAARPHR
ncbi:hypothetical protein PX554_00900 [Sphingomonas sp. H39-1-10]|uniref:hypothetical protein n=1 Tax=Sphingomonas TaxID=13687 RepID=UPI000892319C|nr:MULTISPECIES: hypothetical protein [Sphingomonas]MDF0486672.1 hypothetical protein [Sphingomonas pollutisoli]SDA35579.1 hypothetical protein SAMN03159340_03311 [Sphingomonas sp. NFR15]